MRKRTPKCNAAATAITVTMAVRIVDTSDRWIPIQTIIALVTTTDHAIMIEVSRTNRRSASETTTTIDNRATVRVASLAPSALDQCEPVVNQDRLANNCRAVIIRYATVGRIRFLR